MEPLYRMQVERKKSNNNNRLLLSRRVFVQVPWIEVFACSCPFSAVCYRCYFFFSLHFALNKRPVIPMAPASIPLHRKSLLPNQGQTNWKIITKLKFFPIENLWNGFKIATGSGRWFLFFIIISLKFLPLLIQMIKKSELPTIAFARLWDDVFFPPQICNYTFHSIERTSKWLTNFQFQPFLSAPVDRSLLILLLCLWRAQVFSKRIEIRFRFFTCTFWNHKILAYSSAISLRLFHFIRFHCGCLRFFFICTIHVVLESFVPLKLNGFNFVLIAKSDKTRSIVIYYYGIVFILVKKTKNAAVQCQSEYAMMHHESPNEGELNLRLNKKQILVSLKTFENRRQMKRSENGGKHWTHVRS